MLAPGGAFAWGDRAHLAVTRLAAESLSGRCADYFQPHTEVLAKKSFEPDSVLRKREGREEEIRHFLNLDAHMPPPFRDFPRDFRDAAQRFGKARVEKRGVLPWVILRFERELVQALQGNDQPTALRKAAYLSHYIADAYQPLHLTVDYDGKKSGHAGVHRRYENDYVDARIKELSAAIRPRLAGVRAVENLRDTLFEAIFASYAGVTVIFRADAAAEAARAELVLGAPGAREYARVMADSAGEMTVDQLTGAARLLGAAWMKACLDAGL